MSVYYFFSGFDREKGFTPEIGQSLRENIISRKSLVFIASCPFPYNHEKTDFYKGVMTNWFINAGLEFENVEMLDDRKTATECAELIKNASAIFICGGTTLLQIEFIRNYNLISLLKDFDGVIMGMSAGAINMAVNSFYSSDRNWGETHIYNGIGLADISVEPHFSIDNINLIEKDLLPFSEKIDIYAMCDDSAVVVYENQCQYFGDIYFVSKGKMEKIGQPHKNF
jgi:peptidase E